MEGSYIVSDGRRRGRGKISFLKRIAKEKYLLRWDIGPSNGTVEVQFSPDGKSFYGKWKRIAPKYEHGEWYGNIR